ncbi:sigma 54-interacting transcriptional regulator [bacterium]|nr:sigma 54-interacting transcriptional regulator [bacterium]
MIREEFLQDVGSRLLRYWRFRIEQDGASFAGGTDAVANRLPELLDRSREKTGALQVSEDSPESEQIRHVFPAGPPGLFDFQKLAHELSLPDRSLPVQSSLIGESKDLKRVIQTALNISRSRIPILIRGETGTGKELLAELIHSNSERRHGPWIPVNCGALTESLLDSELFGYEPNSFTGAGPRGREGRIEAAHGGTLFLDEIAELPLAGQAKLLRFLDRGELQRVGRTKPVQVDVRVICATHQNLEALVERKKFRQDLYYRIALMDLFMPPLRDRKEDIPLLVTHFMNEFRQSYAKLQPDSISEDTLIALRKRSWPGNIRELRFTVERAFLQCGGAQIQVEQLPKEKELTKQQSESLPLSQLESQLAEKLSEARDSLFPDREKWAKFLLSQNSESICNHTIVDYFKISEASARIRLNSLTQLKILRPEGSKKGRKYYLLPPFSA